MKEAFLCLNSRSNPVDGCGRGRGDVIGRFLQRLVITVVDEHGTVTRKIRRELFCRLRYQVRLRFAACAIVSVIIGTNPHIVETKRLGKGRIGLSHELARDSSVRDVGLIGNQHEQDAQRR
jgi:hypothetical protein